MLRTIVPAALLVAAWLWLFWPIVAGGRALFYGDFALYFVPELAFLQRELAAGRIPLWNPYLLCGVAFVGNPQAWPLHPSTLLLWAMSPERAGSWMGALHCLLGAWGMRQFLRRQGRGEAAALLGAIAFGLGGATVSKLQFPNMAQSLAYLPWLLLAIDRVLERPSGRRVALLAGTLALAILAAHPQMTLFQLYLAVAWTLWRRPGRRRMLALLGGAALAGLLASAYLLPVVEVARDSLRPELGLVAANRFILPPSMVLTAFLEPRFFGDPALAPPWVGRGNFWEPCAYAGLIPFGLAVATGLRLWREPSVRFWGIVLIASVWLATGRSGGLFAVAYYLLPGLSKFHDPARFLHLSSFGLAWLAARGLDGTLPAKGIRRTLIGALALGLTAIDLVPFSAALNPTVPESVYGDARATLSAKLAGAGRVWHRDESPLWRRFVYYPDYAMAVDPAGARAFLESGVPNLTQWVGVADAGGYEPVRRADFEPRRKRLQDRKRAAAEMRALAAGDRLSLEPLGLGVVRTPLAGARPRAFRLGADGRPVALGVTDVGPDRVELALDGVAGRVVLVDTLASSWSATIDGNPVAAERFEGTLRAVSAPAGGRRLVWRCAPTAWRLGVFLSALGMCIMGILWHGRTEH